MTTDLLSIRYEAIIKGGLQFSGVHEKITKWVKTVPDAYLDKSLGISYINGRIFINHIVFKTEEDLLMCMMLFSEYLYPVR